MNFNQFIGKRISEIRLQQNLSQEELAFRAGIDRTYISSIERGKRSISLFVAFKISIVLKVDLNNLTKKDDGTHIDDFDISGRDKLSNRKH